MFVMLCVYSFYIFFLCQPEQQQSGDATKKASPKYKDNTTSHMPPFLNNNAKHLCWMFLTTPWQ